MPEQSVSPPTTDHVILQPSAEPDPVKPGWRTSEFWLSVAAIALTALFASGALTSTTSLAIAGMAATVLTALGYKVSRTMVKTAASGLLVVLVVGASMGSTACTSSQRTAVAHVIWDCTAPERAEAVAALTPLADSAIALATNPDGTLDTAKLKASFTGANLLTEAGVLIACAAVGSLAVLRTPPAGPITQALSSGSASPRANPQAADRALAELRAPWGAARFRVQAGEL